MDWSIYAFWDYYHWTAMAFAVIIVLEMAFAMLYGKRLFSRKLKSKGAK